MKLIHKVKWVSGILLVFVIVLTTNLVDKDNFNRLRYSILTIYEDRIVANDLIFEMSLLIHEKELAAVTSDPDFFPTKNTQVNLGIRTLIERYEQTKLTLEEEEIFNDLKRDLKSLETMEQEFVTSGINDQSEYLSRIEEVVQSLYDLTKVQLEEGRRQVAQSNRTMETIDLFTQIEIVFLVIMAILVQVIILYQPKQE